MHGSVEYRRSMSSGDFCVIHEQYHVPSGGSLPAKRAASERQAEEIVLAAVNEVSNDQLCARIASKATAAE